MEFYKKACMFYVDHTIDTEMEWNDKEGYVTISIGEETEKFDSFEEMYYGLEIYIALRNDYEEEPKMLEDYGFTKLEIEKILKEEN